jgi:GxxExxY protein
MEEKELTATIISKFYKVYNALGYGFIEGVYHNAMILELADDGLVVESQRPIAVHYEKRIVGTFSADLVVNGLVIVELKAKERIIEPFEAQLINYLRATDIEIGLLLNFGKSPEFKRKFFSNANKKLSASVRPANALENLFLDDPFESA